MDYIPNQYSSPCGLSSLNNDEEIEDGAEEKEQEVGGRGESKREGRRREGAGDVEGVVEI
jgi:hypothetical protein